jgi:hypothetical protein
VKRDLNDSPLLGGEWPQLPRDYRPPAPIRTGWRAALLLAAIAFVILGVASYMAMLWHHAGGGR